MEDLALPHIVKINTSGIYVPQNARCPLWRACVVDRADFRSICRQHDDNWLRLRQNGFNRNFLTRERWLDIGVLVDVLHLALVDLQHDLGVSPVQVAEWQLTAAESKRLNLHNKNRFVIQDDLSWLADPPIYDITLMEPTSWRV